MPFYRNLDRRLARAQEAIGRLPQAHRIEAAGRRRQELEHMARLAGFIRMFAAPEDAGPGLTKAFELGDAAVAELGYEPVTPPATAEDLARLPRCAPPEWLAYWRKLEHLWRCDDPGQAPRTVMEVYVRCIARCCGGEFPFYTGDE